jgi:hypothetical protein
VSDRSIAHGNKEIVVPLAVPSSLALLLETALDELTAALTSHDKRVKTVDLMFWDFLTGSGKTKYFVVLRLKAAVQKTIALKLSREVARWREETLRRAAMRPTRRFVPHDA